MGGDLRELLGHAVKQGGIGIPDPRKSAERGHATSVEAYEVLIKSLLEESDLNYVGHWSCARKAITRERKAREREESAALAERK